MFVEKGSIRTHPDGSSDTTENRNWKPVSEAACSIGSWGKEKLSENHAPAQKVKRDDRRRSLIKIVLEK